MSALVSCLAENEAGAVTVVWDNFNQRIDVSISRGQSQHRRQVKKGLRVMRLIGDLVNDLSAVEALLVFLVHIC